jgi:hypothetical protein
MSLEDSGEASIGACPVGEEVETAVQVMQRKLAELEWKRCSVCHTALSAAGAFARQASPGWRFPLNWPRAGWSLHCSLSRTPADFLPG